MKKLFTSFLAAGTVASFAFCAQNEANTAAEETTTETEETTTETEETTTVVKGKVAKGTFKIGYAGSNTEYTSVLKEILTSYTQDIVDKNATGDEFYELPSGLFLKSSDKYNAYIREDDSYITAWQGLKTWLKTHVVFLDANADDGGTTTETNVYATYGGATSGGFTKSTAILGLVGATQDTLATTTDFDRVFSDDVIKKIFEALETKSPTNGELKTALVTAGLKAGTNLNFDAIDGSSGNIDGQDTIFINTGATGAGSAISSVLSKTWETIQEEFKATVTKSLDDKTKLASNNIDALFVHVTDEVENKSDVYKAVVEKKQFKATKLFFIGEESKAQSGASSKVFAGENVSTASFNQYAAAYIAGFQAAVGAIKFSGSEDVYENTSVSFLIGSTSESTDKKKAFAFRRGVEAAAAHESYSKYLEVKFVSKTEDSSKSAKKLYREISEWKEKDDSKYKLYEFSSSDTFSDADRRVVYIAGATARDWSGYNTSDGASDAVDTFKAGDDIGLVGALYNYGDLSTSKVAASTLTSKTFSRGVWVVLDEATAGTAANDDVIINDNKHSLSYVEEASKGQINLERHDVKFYGSIGTEIKGTKAYAKAALKGLYMGGPSYMIGKHTIFGAGLDLTYVTLSDSSDTKWTNDNSIWSASSGKDTAGKAEGRFKDSFAHATEKELIEEELVKTSPWLK